MEALSKAFQNLGLDTNVISTLLKSTKKATIVYDAIKEAGVVMGCDKAKGHLIYNVAMTLPETCILYRPILLGWVNDGKVKSNLQITEAVNYLKKLPANVTIDPSVLEQVCGIGIEVSEDEIRSAISNSLSLHQQELLQERYTYPISKLLYSLKEGRMKWADGKLVKACFDQEVFSLLGEETEADRTAMKEKKKRQSQPTNSIPDGFVEARYLETSKNTRETDEQHRKRTGNILRCRFPPEPNGYLHIGHAKSMYLNFKGAFDRLGRPGETFLRFDDTNPDTEKLEFVDNILEDVRWLGWSPTRITYSSDYFDQLYEYALKLIRLGKAYVDHQSGDEIKHSREIAMKYCHNEERREKEEPESPWRNRSIAENLHEFVKMREGKYEEGKATLRMKIDMRSPNPCMWDPVAYRIKHKAHPHVGDKWCIYPSYDFQHCLVDSLEDIDYSLCTQEFEIRRESYYWLVNQLDLWKAYVWEFGRLNLTHTIMSKRKLKELVSLGIVNGWDDPRMTTIKGLRRRGFTAASINAFCADISVSRTTTTTIDWSRMEHFLRMDLDKTCSRAFAVLDPIKLTLVNKDPNEVSIIRKPCDPNNPNCDLRELPYQRELYIERDDIRIQDELRFLGLAPGKIVSLRYADVVKCEEIIFDGDIVKEVKARILNEQEVDIAVSKMNSKLGSIHWLAGSRPGEKPQTGEIRLYNHLFTTKNPLDVKSWKNVLNKWSEIIVPNAMMEASLFGRSAEYHVQLERLGYFVVDPDSSKHGIVYNRTCSLRS